jgi:ribosomal protein S18 acetylase RimI-like enzyme
MTDLPNDDSLKTAVTGTSMTEITIERITAISDEVVAAAQLLTPQLESSNQVAITAQYLERVIGNPDNIWLMARQAKDARLIGMASLVIMATPTNVRASLENVVVDSEVRGIGAGVALCMAAKVIADEQNVNTLRAAASKNNAASQRMLQKAGFDIETSMDYFELSIAKGPRF